MRLYKLAARISRFIANRMLELERLLWYMNRSRPRSDDLKRWEVFTSRINHKRAKDRCWIIGNGPSLRDINLTTLNQEFLITVNTFFRHPSVTDLSPALHCFGDKNIFSAGSNSFKYLSEAAEKLPKSQILLPSNTELMHSELITLFGSDRICTFNYLDQPIYKWLPEYPDLSRGVPWVQNVVQLAIMAAMSLKFQTIYLIGCDHNWFQAPRGNLSHFFDGRAIETSKIPDISTKPYSNQVWFASIMFDGYKRLDAMARRHGVNIVNLTGSGCLDVFRTAKLSLTNGISVCESIQEPEDRCIYTDLERVGAL